MSNKMTQKEAVFSAVINVCGPSEGGYSPTKEQRAQINAILFEGFRSDKIVLEKEYDDAGLKAYVSGLQSNWLRKDKRLNGNVSYVAKNPGSRQGSTDPQLKALRALLTTMTSEEEKAEVQGYIDARVSEINASKIKSNPINFDVLPEALKTKFVK